MKLSEAIRLGAMLKPQGVDEFYNKQTKSTCALGAALDSCGRLNTDDPRDGAQNTFIETEWPLRSTRCPVCERKLYDTFRIVTHLNDWHCWTREQVADFISTIEPQETPAAPLEVTADVLA